MLRELAAGVYAYEQLPGGWCLNNAGLVRAGDRTVLIDTAATVARARRLRAAVRAVAPAGPDLVVNTHFHGDHTFGNAVFAPALVVAHAGTRRDMAEAGLGLCALWPAVDWGDVTLRLPDVTFTDTMAVGDGPAAVELIHVGAAHTAADVVAWLPGPRVLFAGDVAWSGVTPFVLMGSVSGSLRVLRRLAALDPAVVVCGHGPVAGPEVLDATAGYLHWVGRVAERGLGAGRTPLAAARAAGPGPYRGLVDPERLAGNLHRAYAELAGLAPGARLDVAAAFADMVALHGGLPPCAA
ncbi:MBL fold metallo-hydrolase [Pilimelia anulata]|uniref:MBL fold metallo-hydrolase n=1 Tax=Pilimelia anulata TaxID=53371 RepID=A0A8J3BBX2_9ACTN|nr:MBL fold metallo-hydrolase [Pilimelia anulata]GGJ96504.1 MBL fold metallo-hydrolase [Pilimelia anulata]